MEVDLVLPIARLLPVRNDNRVLANDRIARELSNRLAFLVVLESEFILRC